MFSVSSWLSHEQHKVRKRLFCLHIQFPCIHLFIVSFHLWLFCFSFVIIYICVFSFNYINQKWARDFFCTFNIFDLSLCNYFQFYSFLPLSPPFFEFLCDHQSYKSFTSPHFEGPLMLSSHGLRVYGDSFLFIIDTYVMSVCVCCQEGQKKESDPLILSYWQLWMACCGCWEMNSSPVEEH